MSIGLSLPVEFLSGIGTSKDTEHLRQTFGAPDALLSELTARGIAAIEIKSMYRETTAEANLRAFEKAAENGRQVRLHAFMPEVEEADNLEIAFACYASLFERIRVGGGELIMILHALRDEDLTVPDNRDATVTVLKRLAAFFDRTGTPIRLALEINRDHGRPDPSYTYDGVLEMVDAIEGAGICFDFGHTFWNVERFELPAAPPEAFLKKVIHTHIHDIGTGGTHYPLSVDVVPVGDYVRRLQEAGYQGVFNLELGCYRFAEEMDVKNGFLESVDILRETVSP